MAGNTNSQIGSKTTLGYWSETVSPVGYQTLGQVRSIQGVGVNKPEVESTTLDSEAVERISGLADGKQITVVLTVNATNLALIEGFVAAGVPLDLKLSIPAPTSDSRYFSALPLDYDMGTISPSGLMEITLQARMTGAAPSAVSPHSPE